MERILITNGTIWNGERFESADILVKNGCMAKIGSKLCDPAELVYDASGRIGSAGLVDGQVVYRH